MRVLKSTELEGIKELYCNILNKDGFGFKVIKRKLGNILKYTEHYERLNDKEKRENLGSYWHYIQTNLSEVFVILSLENFESGLLICIKDLDEIRHPITYRNIEHYIGLYSHDFTKKWIRNYVALESKIIDIFGFKGTDYEKTLNKEFYNDLIVSSNLPDQFNNSLYLNLLYKIPQYELDCIRDISPKRIITYDFQKNRINHYTTDCDSKKIIDEIKINKRSYKLFEEEYEMFYC